MGVCRLCLLGQGFVNLPNHVKRTLRDIFKFIAQDSRATVERIFQADQLALHAGELLRREKRLGQKPLQPTRTANHVAIFL
jgi:hypothetical protein